MTDVERVVRSSPRSSRSQKLRQTAGLLTAVVAVSLSTVLPFARSGADQLSDAQAKAAQLTAQVQATGREISELGQQYDKDQYELSQLHSSIASTETRLAQAQKQVSSDIKSLRSAAVNAYVDDGAQENANPLFSRDGNLTGDQQEYSQVAEGDLNTDVADLHVAQSQLSLQQSSLTAQENQVQAASNQASAALAQANALSAQQHAALAQETGEVAVLVAQQQEQEAEAAESAAQARMAELYNGLPPPPNGLAGAAVEAAESQLGVPYRWGAESPKGTPDPGFDCSGLTAWSWGQAGVPLPHYSGSQMDDSTPVPLSDLQPGDLLFYGPGGDEHVAMYIGDDEMIEAPYTGAYVWITGVRLGGDFVGAGRP